MSKFIDPKDIDLDNLDELDEFDFEDKENFSQNRHCNDYEEEYQPKNSKKNKLKRK